MNRSLPRRLNLLLAEDNLPDALLVREAIRLEKLPVELHVVADGPQALEFLARAERDPNAPCPQLLLLDLNLPMVDGLEVLRHVRASEKFKTLPVLVVTSSDAPSDRSQAAELGAGYFRKSPVYSDYLKIGRVLKEALEKNGLL